MDGKNCEMVNPPAFRSSLQLFFLFPLQECGSL